MATPAKVTKPEGKNNHEAADDQAGLTALWFRAMLIMSTMHCFIFSVSTYEQRNYMVQI
jgi:hypothetical protein